MLAHMLLALLLQAAPADAPQPVTRKNLRTHPEIGLVRTEYELIERALSEGRLTQETSEFPDCLMYEGDLKRSVWRDDRGRIRLLVAEQGSDDSTVTLRHSYDDAGRLRFVFITGGAVNDSKLEHRVWLSPLGKRLWEEHKYVAGPGYTFPRVWPDKELATNATERWSRALRCERAVAGDPKRSAEDTKTRAPPRGE